MTASALRQEGESGLGGVRRVLRRVLSLSRVLHHGDVAISAIHSVGHSLEATVRQVDVVLSVGQIAIPGLLSSEVVAGVVVLDGVLPGVDGGHIGVLVHVGLVGRGGLVDHGGRLVDHGRLVDRGGPGVEEVDIRASPSLPPSLSYLYTTGAG